LKKYKWGIFNKNCSSIGQGFTVGSSKQLTQVAIGSSYELPLPIFFKAVAHTLLHTHQSSQHTVTDTLSCVIETPKHNEFEPHKERNNPTKRAFLSILPYFQSALP